MTPAGPSRRAPLIPVASPDLGGNERRYLDEARVWILKIGEMWFW